MSWQAYVDTSLVSSGQVDKAAIVSAAGDSIWAKSKDFDVEPQEMKFIVEALNAIASGSDTKVWGEGVHIGGEKYITTKAESRSIYARQGKEGIIISKTTQAILIAHYGENVQAGNAAQTVEKLADYLIGVGY